MYIEPVKGCRHTYKSWISGTSTEDVYQCVDCGDEFIQYRDGDR